METATDQLALVIGERVKRERQSLGWTLDQLAETADVSRRMVVNIEQGAVNPSIGTLLKLSDAMGVGLPALVEPPRSQQLQITRAGEAPVLWQGENGGRAQLVANTERPDILELWDWTLGPGDIHASEAHTKGTHELIQVLQGELTVVSGDQTVLLGVGDAISLPGDRNHSYQNLTAEPASFVLAVFQPGVGSQSGKGVVNA